MRGEEMWETRHPQSIGSGAASRVQQPLIKTCMRTQPWLTAASDPPRPFPHTYAPPCPWQALRDWPAYRDCRRQIEEFYEVLPLLQGLTHPATRPRHWTQLQVGCR